MNQPKASNPSIDPTYWEYIRLDRLLTIQGGVSGGDEVESADELHFIVIHQAIELLFKLILRELRDTRAALARPHIEEDAVQVVVQHLGRVNEALRVTTSHFAFMETLGTQGFLSFRAGLGTSSGAQSFQMRELEELLGLPRSERDQVLRRLRAELREPAAVAGFESFMLEPFTRILKRIRQQIEDKASLGIDDGPDQYALTYVQAVLSDLEAKGTLRNSLAGWLFRTPICGSAPAPDENDGADKTVVRRFVANYVERGRAAGWTERQADDVQRFFRGSDAEPLDWVKERVRAALLFIETYSDLPLLAWPRLLLDRLVELETQLVGFRNGHARMVERVMGDRPGTGGSAGLRYLDLTRDMRVFPELIQIRGLLLPVQDRWRFPGIERYGFVRS